MPAAFSFTLDSTVPSAFCFSESDVSSFVVKALGIECLECRGSLPWRESPDVVPYGRILISSTSSLEEPTPRFRDALYPTIRS